MRILICEDEAKTRESCTKAVNQLLIKHNYVMRVLAFEMASQMMMELEDFSPSDIIIMDVKMPGIDGITAAKKLRGDGFQGELIFFTNSRYYWPEAFEVEALNYLVKSDCKMDDFERVLLRAIARVTKKKEQMIWLTCGYESRHIVISEISYFEVRDKKLTVYYNKNEQFTIYSSIARVEEMLRPLGFVRTHRAFLVSIAHIAALDSSWATLRGGQKIPIGDRYKATVTALYNSHGRIEVQ